MTDNLIEGRTGKWELVSGLEIHAQVVSKSKLFSGASTTFGSEANSQVSLVDAAMPGMLPVLNMECVRQAVLTGLALGAKINLHSVFARKHYFYPDLPQGYQISQFDQPIVGEGVVKAILDDGSEISVGVERLHLEQDAGKSIHDQSPDSSYIDLNRSGIALMEIVSKPDLRSPDEAVAYLRTIRTILRYIGSCDGNMQEGSMRADANVSVRRPGEPMGTRCEIKNLNSMRFLRQAMQIEAERQIALIEAGGVVDQETRLFDPDRSETRSMRSKEEAHDYRYFPDPDLPPLVISEDYVESCRQTLPELPEQLKSRFVSEYGLSNKDASLLVSEVETAEYYEALCRASSDPKMAANWLMGDLMGHLNRIGSDIKNSPVSPASLGDLLKLIQNDKISGKIAKDVLQEMFDTGDSSEQIVQKKGLSQISNEAELAAMVAKLVADNPDKVASIKNGKTGLIGWFVGQVMQQTKGRANPGMVNKLLQAAISDG